MASMELREIKEITTDILNDLRNSSKGMIYRKYDTILALFDMERKRDFEILKKVDYQLHKHGVTFWCGKEERRLMRDFERGESITFRMSQSADDNGGASRDGGRQFNSPHAGTIEISQETSGITLYQHQIDAVEKLNAKVLKTRGNPFAGLLVLPTGGGKPILPIHPYRGRFYPWN